MIYASTSMIVNVSASGLWQRLEDFIKSLNQGKYISQCSILENYYDGFMRVCSMEKDGEVKERVFLLKDQNKIIIRLEDHPLFIGDMIYQIVASDQEQLFDRRSTLCLVLSWRMRPGVIEAPHTNKQYIIEDLIESIAAEFI